MSADQFGEGGAKRAGRFATLGKWCWIGRGAAAWKLACQVDIIIRPPIEEA